MDNPLGKRFHLGPGGAPIEVVGVTEDGKYEVLVESQKLAIFLPATQQYNTTTTMIVRSSLPEEESVRKNAADMWRLLILTCRSSASAG